MTILSLADSCRQLSIDPKTLRRWLAQAPFTLQPHAHDARRTGLADEQLRWLAQAHHRRLTGLAQEPSQPAPAPSTEVLALPGDLHEVLQTLCALPAQLAALQEQLADLTHHLSHLPEPATTTRSRSGATTRAAGRSRSGSRSRTESLRQPQRPSKAQVYTCDARSASATHPSSTRSFSSTISAMTGRRITSLAFRGTPTGGSRRSRMSWRERSSTATA